MDAPHFAALLTDWRTGTTPSLPSLPLYLRLSAAFSGAIGRGQLVPGEQLPAERPLADLLGISRSTVVAAYDELAAEGWVTRKRGSGTHVSAAAPRQTPLLTLRTPVHPHHRPETDGGDVDFTIAVPLLTDEQRRELVYASADAFQESLYYPLGLPDLRAFLAAEYSASGLPTTPEQVIITSGAQQAISLLATTLLRPGDAALLETPTYFGAIDVMRAAGASLVGVPVSAQGMSPDDFARLLRQHSPRLAFLTPSFQNPTGSVLSAGQRERIAAHIAQARLPTIEDDTLLDLSFGAPPPPRLSCYATNSTTNSTAAAPIFNVGSMSKLYWAGLRVGWMRVPHDWRPVLTQAKTLADFGGSLSAQHLSLRLLQDLPRLRQRRRELVQPARDLLATLLRQHLPDWSFSVPEGGQYLWVTLPAPVASSFTHHAARYGVRLFPGASMGVSTGGGDMPDRYLRLPFTLAPEQLPGAVERLRDAWADFERRSGQERLA